MSSSQRWLLVAGLLLAGVLIYLLKPILAPFLAGALLAYLGSPLVDRLERLRLPRSGAVLLVFLALSIVIVGLAFLVVPLIGNQIEYLQRNLPAIMAWLQERTLPWLASVVGRDLDDLFDLESISGMITDHWRETGDMAGIILGHVTRSGLAFAAFLFNLVLAPVVTFYLLRDWHRVTAAVRSLLPRRLEPTLVTLASECDSVLGAFLRGQLIVMLSLGIFYAAGLWLIGLDVALLIGLVAGLFSIVPYLGTIIGVSAAIIATLFQFGAGWALVAVAVLFVVGNVLENTVLTPLLVGDRIGLHPVAVIFAVLAGGQLFGFVGVLLALPAAAVIMVLVRHAHQRYRDSDLYANE